MDIQIVNPLNRVPLALIIDDSAPCINLAYYFMKQRLELKAKHPGMPIRTWEGDPNRAVESLPHSIPSDFAKKFGEWCIEQGVKGKFSLIPCPAGLGRIDQQISGYSRKELSAWLDVSRNIIHKNFDITPEMLTHTVVMNLDTWEPTEEWEQVEWVNPVPEDLLIKYIATSFQILRNVGIYAEGVTSPGGFGGKMEDRYARATLIANKQVNKNNLPFYFHHIYIDRQLEVPVYYANPDKGEAVISIIGCTGDWFGGWTGYDLGKADKYITKDLKSGRLPEVLKAKVPCILVGHWPGIYFGGEEKGFEILKEVKRRLDMFDPDKSKTLWMKTSEIARYFAVKKICSIKPQEDECFLVHSPVSLENFTMKIIGLKASSVNINNYSLQEVYYQRDFLSNTFLVKGNDIFIAFNLIKGDTKIKVI